jgi:hypothetical protein
VDGEMRPSRKEHEILNPIVRNVLIYMMDHIAFRDDPMIMNPDLTM